MTDKFKRWYDVPANRDARNERRRSKYAADPDYRAKARGKPRLTRGHQLQGSWSTLTVFTPEGVPVVVYSVAALVAATRASPQTLRAWTAEKKISPPDHVTPTGVKYYTAQTLERICADIQAAGLSPRSKRDETREATVELPSGERHKVMLYPVGDLALVLQRRIATVERLEKSGVIPETPFRLTSQRRRYYTLGMLKAVEAAYAEVVAHGAHLFRTGTDVSRQFQQRLQEAWEPLSKAKVCDE